VVEASWQALVDSISFGLLRGRGAEEREGSGGSSPVTESKETP